MANENLTDFNSAEARARRRRENLANLSATEKLKSNASVVVAVAAGVIVSCVKFVAASITGSSAMFSEGIHSMVDAINDSLLLVGNRCSKRNPDVQHPFGYGSEVYFYSHTVALVIFVFGGGFVMYEALLSIRAGGHPIESPIINYIVLGIGIILEGFSLSVAVHTVNKARGDMRIMTYIRESKSPTNITVFLEDTAAVLGMVVALVGNILSQVTGNYIIDAWASLLIGAVMAIVAIVILRETRGLLIGEGLTFEEVKDVVYIVESDPVVIKCGRVLSLYLGPDDLLINMDVTFRDDLSEGGVLVAIDRIEDEVMGEYPQATRVFIEAESLNQVYRQRYDRKLLFEEYEEEKRLEDQGSRSQRDSLITDDLKARREEHRAELARMHYKGVAATSDAEAGTAGSEERPATNARVSLFDEIPQIEGDRIVLNMVVDTDADALQELVDNDNVYRFSLASPYERQQDDVRKTIRLFYSDLFANKKSLVLGVRMRDTGEISGLVELYGLRERQRKVSVSFRLLERYWGQGIATEALGCVVGYLYGRTSIEIITASTMIEDEASPRVLKKNDFARTARSVEEDWGYDNPTVVDKWLC